MGMGMGRGKHLPIITQRRPVGLRPALSAKAASGRAAQRRSLGKSSQGSPRERLGRALQARPQCSQTRDDWRCLADSRMGAVAPPGSREAYGSRPVLFQRLQDTVRNSPRVMGRGLSLVSVHLLDNRRLMLLSWYKLRPDSGAP